MNLFNIVNGYAITSGVITISDLIKEHESASRWFASQVPVMQRGRLSWHEVAAAATCQVERMTNHAILMGTPELLACRDLNAIVMTRLREKLAIPKQHSRVVAEILDASAGREF